MTLQRPANLDLLVGRYAEWRAEYLGEDSDEALRQVTTAILGALPPAEVWGAGGEIDRWVLAITGSPCWEWTAKAGSQLWDPLSEDLNAFQVEHPGAELALIPRALPSYRLFEFLA